MMIRLVCLLVLAALSVYVHSQSVCHLGADIALVFDIGPGKTDIEQEKLRDFGDKMVDMAASNPPTQLAIISYDTEARERVTLKEWGVSEAREQIFKVFQSWDDSTDQTHRAMDLMHRQTFSIEYGSRSGINNVSIILTDRPSSNPTEAARRATRLKAGGTVVYVLSIGDKVPSAESSNYATSSAHILNVPTFADLPVEFTSLKSLAFDCSPCPAGWITQGSNDDYCYKYVKDQLSWSDAKNYCTLDNADANLITFSSAEQATWVRDAFIQGPNGMVWVGLSRLSVTEDFMYIGNTPLDTSIVPWESGNPGSQLCVAYGSAGLNDESCAGSFRAVCMVRKDALLTP